MSGEHKSLQDLLKSLRVIWCDFFLSLILRLLTQSSSNSEEALYNKVKKKKRKVEDAIFLWFSF